MSTKTEKRWIAGMVQVQCVEAPDGVLTVFIGRRRVTSPLETLANLPRRGPKRVLQ